MCESFYSAANTDTFYRTKYFQPTAQSLLTLFKEKHAASSVACSLCTSPFPASEELHWTAFSHCLDFRLHRVINIVCS